MAPSSTRICGFIDMDCFYVAVERARDPRLYGIPCAVMMYNTWQRGQPDLLADMNRTRTGNEPTGGIIAVSYEARARGVTRSMSAKEAMKACPDIKLIQVPTGFGKADLRIYKAAGDEVVALLARRSDATEKRSVDEVAIDITTEAERVLRERDWATDLLPTAQQVTHLADSKLSRKAAAVTKQNVRLGHDGQQKVDVAPPVAESTETLDGWAELTRRISAHDELSAEKQRDVHLQKLLVAGAIVVAEMRAEVKAKLGFTCSGGVATNKLLAKLGCGLHKPDQQTILFPHSVSLLMQDLPLDRVTGLGGDFGEKVKAALGVATCGELLAKSREEVLHKFPERGDCLLAMAAGKDQATDPVKDRQLTKSLSNGKQFFGTRAIRTPEEAEHWLEEFAGELHIRYQEQVKTHGRAPTTVCISVGMSSANPGDKMSWAAYESQTRQQSIDLGRTGTVRQIADGAKSCFRKWHAGLQGKAFEINMLGMSLTNMEDLGGRVTLTRFFSKSKEIPPAISSAPTLASKEQTQAAAPAMCPELCPETIVQVLDDGDDTPSTSTNALDVSAVDESVLAELPWSIQQEIRSQMRAAASRANTGTEALQSGSSLDAAKQPKRRRVEDGVATHVTEEILID
eukprot:TRINITY_DN46582_c0_g1_i1.p1 TRINITY_DN46582_c0_g1~~TRINITY_DN46582_c0_g1_i1.p1  ORF type:complete len:687 (+),score=96.86 TRINITY_DN46582_c0_g1_i1:180-2063(+)